MDSCISSSSSCKRICKGDGDISFFLPLRFSVFVQFFPLLNLHFLLAVLVSYFFAFFFNVFNKLITWLFFP